MPRARSIGINQASIHNGQFLGQRKPPARPEIPSLPPARVIHPREMGQPAVPCNNIPAEKCQISAPNPHVSDLHAAEDGLRVREQDIDPPTQLGFSYKIGVGGERAVGGSRSGRIGRSGRSARSEHGNNQCQSGTKEQPYLLPVRVHYI